MNEYSFEIKKKYGGEHPSYSGVLTCNGSEYSMMLSADEGKEFSATIRDTAEMQKAYSQQDRSQQDSEQLCHRKYPEAGHAFQVER